MKENNDVKLGEVVYDTEIAPLIRLACDITHDILINYRVTDSFDETGRCTINYSEHTVPFILYGVHDDGIFEYNISSISISKVEGGDVECNYKVRAVKDTKTFLEIMDMLSNCQEYDRLKMHRLYPPFKHIMVPDPMYLFKHLNDCTIMQMIILYGITQTLIHTKAIIIDESNDGFWVNNPMDIYNFSLSLNSYLEITLNIMQKEYPIKDIKDGFYYSSAYVEFIKDGASVEYDTNTVYHARAITIGTFGPCILSK